MKVNDIWVVFGVVLGFYLVVFVFVRRFNELWSFVKLGRKVYQALPPGHMGWPLIGSSLSLYNSYKFSDDPDSFLNHLISKNGRIGMYKSHLYGKLAIIITDSEICRRIYLDSESFEPDYPKSAAMFTGSGSAMKIDHRSVYRLIAAPINGSEALSNYVDYIEKEVVKGLEEWSSMREPIELLNEIRSLYFKLFSRIFLGANLSGSRRAELETLFTQMAHALMSIFPYDLPGFAFHSALKARKGIEKILQTMIEEKRRAIKKNEREENCQIEALIEANDGNGAKLLSENAIIDMLLAPFHAANHTAAHAAMWVLIHISDHPQVFQKAKEEQEYIVKERPSTQKGLNFKEIKQMSYLTKVINETLRKTTLVPQTFRKAKTDVYINGYIIPKGWSIPIWNRAVHMDPQIYPNPHKFDPSRWDNYKPKAGEFIPFGMGKMYCPGSERCLVLYIAEWNKSIQKANSLTYPFLGL